MKLQLTPQPAMHTDEHRFIYFQVVNGRENPPWRPIDDEEFAFVQTQLPQIQAMADRVLGDDTAKITAVAQEGDNDFYLMIPRNLSPENEAVRSLIGWICLFALEDKSSSRPTLDRETQERIRHIVQGSLDD